METTIDGILNQRVQIEQPAHGYRIAIDTVFLAAAVPARAGQKVADFGTGVGGAMLCLAARVLDLEITGVEIQEELAALCRKNIALNKLGKADVRQEDVTKFSMAGFDHVMMNPPYHDETCHDVSADKSKRIANAEKEGDLALWLESASRALKPGGMLTLIHRADRLNEILDQAKNLFGTIEVLPLLPKVGAPPKRILLRLSKKDGGVTYCNPMTLYRPGGGYTYEAESILRGGEALRFM